MTVWGGKPPGVSGTHWGMRTVGVRGDQVPSSGLNGAGLIYDLIVLPAEAANRFRYRVTARPPLLTFFTHDEYSAFEAEGPDGLHTGTLELTMDGAVVFSVPFDIVIGAGLSGSASLDGIGSAGGGFSLGPASTLTGDAQLGGMGAAGEFSQQGSITGDAALDGVAAAGALVGYRRTLVESLYEVLNPLAPGGAHYMTNESDPATRVWPFIVFQRVAHTPNVTLKGSTNLQNTRVQIDIHARTFAEAESIESVVEQAMAAWAVTNTPVSDVDLVEEVSRSVRIAKDYSIWSTMT